jgi:hypothetical protein
MKRIKLTRNQSALVDDKWFDYLSQWKWHANWNKYTQSFYAVRNQRISSNKRVLIQMSRVVADTPNGMICDHENHNTLDNQEHNLRNVTYSQNNMNSKPRKNNLLGERCIRKKNGKYSVRIFKDDTCAFSRTFSNLEEAKSMRDIMIKEIHGNFAYGDVK